LENRDDQRCFRLQAAHANLEANRRARGLTAQNGLFSRRF
jgi:hypothetical protein